MRAFRINALRAELYDYSAGFVKRRSCRATHAATCSPVSPAQDNDVFFQSSRGHVSQISVAGMPEFRAGCNSNPLLFKASANKLKKAGTCSGSSKCISTRLRSVEPFVPTTRTLLMVVPELGPNIARAISPAQRCFLAGAPASAAMSAFRCVDADGATTWPLPSLDIPNRRSGPLHRVESGAVAPP